MHILLTYLAARPLLNIAELERAAGCHPRCIQNALQNHRNPEKGQPLASKWALPIIRALCNDAGSIVLNGWTVRNDEPSNGFLLEMPIPDREATSLQVDAPDGGHYMEYQVPMYRVPMYRDYMDTSDMLHWLKSAQNG